MSSELGTRLLKARQDAGLSQPDAAYSARAHLPKSIRPTGMTISRLERGENVADAIDIIAALCVVYGQPFADLAPELADDFVILRRLIRTAADPPKGPPRMPVTERGENDQFATVCGEVWEDSVQGTIDIRDSALPVAS